MVVTKRKTVFSLNLWVAVKTETAAWEPRQHIFLWVILTGQWIAVGETLYIYCLGVPYFSCCAYYGSRLGFVVVVGTNFDPGHFIE